MECNRKDILNVQQSTLEISDVEVKRVMRGLESEILALQEKLDFARGFHEARVAEYVELRRKERLITEYLSSRLFRTKRSEHGKQTVDSIGPNEMSQIEDRFKKLFLDYLVMPGGDDSDYDFRNRRVAFYWTLKADFKKWRDDWFGVAGSSVYKRIITDLFEGIDSELMSLTMEMQDHAIDIAGVESCMAFMTNLYPHLLSSIHNLY